MSDLGVLKLDRLTIFLRRRGKHEFFHATVEPSFKLIYSENMLHAALPYLLFCLS